MNAVQTKTSRRSTSAQWHRRPPTRILQAPKVGSNNAPAVSLLRVESPVGDAGARTQPKCGEAAVALAQDLPVHSYRPELHYMRGPGQKCRERDNASARP